MPLQAGGVEEGLTSMEHPQLCSHAIFPGAHWWAFPPTPPPNRALQIPAAELAFKSGATWLQD